MNTPLPDTATVVVGRYIIWQEDRVTLVDGEAVVKPTHDVGLVLGVRWARNVDGKPFGQDLGLVQFLMERPNGTTRWTPALDLP